MTIWRLLIFFILLQPSIWGAFDELNCEVTINGLPSEHSGEAETPIAGWLNSYDAVSFSAEGNKEYFGSCGGAGQHGPPWDCTAICGDAVTPSTSGADQSLEVRCHASCVKRDHHTGNPACVANAYKETTVYVDGTCKWKINFDNILPVFSGSLASGPPTEFTTNATPGIWQFAPATDSAAGDSGFSLYEVYWGKDGSEIKQANQTMASFNPGTLTENGHYNLIVRARDVAGNFSQGSENPSGVEYKTWPHVKSYIFDDQPPFVASEVKITNNTVLLPGGEPMSSGYWSDQNSPQFQWKTEDQAKDGFASHVESDQVYWGPDTGADPATFISLTPDTPPFTATRRYAPSTTPVVETLGSPTTTTFTTVPAIPDCRNYVLKVRSYDRVGNTRGWHTAFEMGYDPFAPSIDSPVALNAATSPSSNGWINQR